MIYFDVHTHKHVNQKNITAIISSSLAEDEGFYSIGIHPWDVDKALNEQLNFVDSLAYKPNVLAIGEIGLDKICNTEFGKQKEFFIEQLRIAQKHVKPVVVHCVKAYEEILDLTKDFELPVIIHGFNKGYELAKQLTDRGYFLSFGKSILDESSKSVTAFKEMRLNRIFLETDEAEVPIEDIYERAAKIKGIELKVISEQIENNFRKVFNGYK